MFKNVATKIALFAFDTTTGAPKTGDAANITAYVSKDYGSVTVLGDTSATEMDATNAKGWYLFDVAQAETNADALLFSGKSSTSNISIVGQFIFTTPANFSSLSVDSNGRIDVIKVAGTTQTAKDIGGAVPAVAAGASGGLLISGSNAGTTTFGALTVTGATTHTGNVVFSDGITVSAPSTANRPGIAVTGNGTGAGVSITGGNGATGNAVDLIAASTNGSGLTSAGIGSGNGIKVTAISGDGVNVSVSTLGHGISTTAAGSSRHGINASGPGAGSASGIAAFGGSNLGDGIRATGSTNGNGINAISGASQGHGIRAQGGLGGAHGIYATGGNGGATGDGFRAEAQGTDGNGFCGIKTGTGKAIKGPVDVVDTATALTTNNDKTGYALGASGLDSGALTAAAKNAIADSVLDRNMATGTDSGTDSTAVRTPRQALRVLRNKNAIAAGTQTVYKEDDSTTSHTAAVTTSAGNPISAVDPT